MSEPTIYKRSIKEWSVEVTMTVLKFVDAHSMEEATAVAALDDDFVRVLQSEVTFVMET